MVPRRIEVLIAVVEVADHEPRERDAVGRQVAAPAQLLGVVREPFIQPQHLRVAALDQHVLVVTDHVLELVDERHRHDMLDLVHAVRAGQHAVGVRHERIKHFGVVEARVAGVERIDVRTEKESCHEPAAGIVALFLRHELIHQRRHQDDHFAVAVHIGFAAEGRRVDRVELVVERRAQGVEVERGQAARRRGVVDVDDQRAVHRFGRGGNVLEHGARQVGAHAEPTLLIQGIGRRRERRHRRGCGAGRRGPEEAPLFRLPQEVVELLSQGGSRDVGLRGGEHGADGVAVQREAGPHARHAGGRLGQRQINGGVDPRWIVVEHDATGIAGGVEHGVGPQHRAEVTAERRGTGRQLGPRRVATRRRRPE